MTVDFMSQEHVDLMNALLAPSEDVRAACAQLAGPRTLGYALTDGPDGADVHWRVTCADTVRFSLDAGPADVLLVGDWAQMIRASRATRDGEVIDAGVRVEGDASVVGEVGRILEVARSVAVVDVSFPEV